MNHSLAGLLLSALLVGWAAPPPLPAQQVLLEDRFQQPDGSPPNPEKWDAERFKSTGTGERVVRGGALHMIAQAGALVARTAIQCPAGKAIELALGIEGAPPKGIATRITVGFVLPKRDAEVFLSNRGFVTDSSHLGFNLAPRNHEFSKEAFRALRVGNFGSFRLVWQAGPNDSTFTVWHNDAKLETVRDAAFTDADALYPWVGYDAGGGGAVFKNLVVREIPASK
jgi:hypothetical protein